MYPDKIPVEDELVKTNNVSPNHAVLGTGQALPVVRTRNTVVGLNPLEILHREWGHLSEKYMKRALKYHMVDGCRFDYSDIKDLELEVCDGCMKGRMRAANKKEGIERSHDRMPFEKIGVDYKGPFPVLSYHKYSGFIALSDYKTHYLDARLVKKKTEALRALHRFKVEVIDKWGKEWKVMQSDWDSIFKSKEVRAWLEAYKIVLQLSAPYTHSENGQIERDIQSLMDKARTLMAIYGAPPSMWEFAIMTAVYLLNRSPHAGSDITPFQALTGSKPNISNLVPFYAPGLYHKTQDERAGAFSYKAEPCRMLGYSEDSFDTFLVLRLRDRKLMYRGDCIFNESDLTRELQVDNMIDPLYNDLFELDEIEQDADDEEMDEIEHLFTRIPVEDRTQGVPRGERLKDDDDPGLLPDDFEEDLAAGEAGKSPRVTELDSDSDYDEEYPYWRPSPSSDEDADYAEARLHYADWLEDTACLVGHADPLPENPKSVAEALSWPDKKEWQEAIDKELMNFDIYESLAVADSQAGRAMKTKMILKYKYDPDYTIRRKARFVVCGYSQVKGIDYKETYAPTTDVPLVFFLLQVGIMSGSIIRSLDVSSAFLEGKNDLDLYATLPPELSPTGVTLRVKLLGSIYGEKQAPLIWNKRWDSVLRTIGFTRCPVSPCLYYRWVEDEYIMLTVHVDDCLIIASSESIVTELQTLIQQHLKKVTLSEDFTRYLGMDLNYIPNSNYILVSQEVYIESKFAEYDHKAATPMEAGLNLRAAEPNPANDSLLPVTGALRYPADHCRPDILVAVGEISTGGTPHPSDEHVKTSERCRNYLTATKGLGLLFGGPAEFYMFAYVDAAYIADADAKSRLGGCLFISKYSGAIYSFSKNDTSISTISHSSTEAEVKAIDEMAREIVHRREVAEFCNCDVSKPTPIYVDNQAAIRLCSSLKSGHKTKHINMRLAYIRELINNGILALYFVPTELNVADVLTKPLEPPRFIRHRTILLEGHDGILPDQIQIINFVHYEGGAADDSA
jgi:hypothetical protein